MCVVYGLNYLDKTTLSYASIMGLKLPPSENKLKSGINLTGDQYQWLASMFYFGYLAWEYPTTRLLQFLPLGKYCRLSLPVYSSRLKLSRLTNYKRRLTSSCGAWCCHDSQQSKTTPAQSPFDSSWECSKVPSRPGSRSSHRSGVSSPPIISSQGA